MIILLSIIVFCYYNILKYFTTVYSTITYNIYILVSIIYSINRQFQIKIKLSDFLTMRHKYNCSLLQNTISPGIVLQRITNNI